MTPEEITELKREISSVISKRMEETFIGQSMSDVSKALVKSHLTGIMKEFLAQGAHSVVDLIQYDVIFQGNQMNIIMEPKNGLSNEDHSRAVNFLFNQEFY